MLTLFFATFLLTQHNYNYGHISHRYIINSINHEIQKDGMKEAFKVTLLKHTRSWAKFEVTTQSRVYSYGYAHRIQKHWYVILIGSAISDKELQKYKVPKSLW